LKADGRPIHRGIIEEIDGLRISHFLLAIYKRSAIHIDGCGIGGQRPLRTSEFGNRAEFGGLVVIGGKAEFEFAFRKTGIFFFVYTEEFEYGRISANNGERSRNRDLQR
jgi:hypothetical protein